MRTLIGLLVLAMTSIEAGYAQEPKPTTVWDGVYSAAQAARGKTAFEAHCSTCHAMDLGGASGPTLKGPTFMEHWREDNTKSLFTRLKTSMPRGKPGSLADDMYLDIMTFVLEANSFPSGSEDLKPDSLASVQITDKEGPSPVPDFALVEMVGCLTQSPDKSWTLTNANTPVRTRNPGEPPAEDLKVSAAKRLGTDTYKLLYVDSFRAGFTVDQHSGHKMQAKGFLIRKPDLRLSVTWLEMLDSSCTPQ